EYDRAKAVSVSSPNIFNRRVNVRHGIRRLFVIALLIYSVRYVSGLLRLTESRPAMPFLSPAMKTDTVRRGRFLKSVPAYGEIRTFRPGVVYNQCRYWPRTIVELVPEGSMVKEGDVLCVLDASEIRSKLQEQTLLLIKARAGHANALALESLQEIQNDRRLNTNSNLADESRGRFIAFDKAESIQELQKLQCDVEFCKESLAVSRESYERTRDFSARGFASLAELEIRRTEFQSDERELAIAEGLLNLASSFQHVRKNAELKFNSELADEELRRTQLQNELASMIQEVKSLEMEQWVSGVQLSVDYLSRALEACTIRAPRSGELIFCHKPDEGRFVEVGGKAHYSQELFWIADRSRLIVAGRVSDTRVNELEEGCVADVRVPTLPDREYCGRLRWIAPIPSPMSPFVPHDLYHDVQIDLEGVS
ncbi:MAG: HlyD family secretion protein, partial [Planctomycetota bacterium]